MVKYCCLIAFAFAGLFTCAQSTLVPAQDKNISYEGRILYNDGVASLMWPGTSIRINFEGTGVSGVFRDADTSNYYNVIVDGAITSIQHFGKEKQTYMLADNLPAGKHTLQLFKRTEWDKGRTWFYGFELNSNTHLLKPPVLPKRKN